MRRGVALIDTDSADSPTPSPASFICVSVSFRSRIPKSSQKKLMTKGLVRAMNSIIGNHDDPFLPLLNVLMFEIAASAGTGQSMAARYVLSFREISARGR
jgi:hypothetical protein